MYACNGILFNHEGPRRGETFITRKVSRYVAQYYHGKVNTPLQIGNVNVIRDWTDARDMVEGIFLMMSHRNPDDYVLGSQKGHTVLQLLEEAFSHIGKIPIFFYLFHVNYISQISTLLPLIIAVYIGTHFGKYILGFIPEKVFRVLFKIALFLISIKLIIFN